MTALEKIDAHTVKALADATGEDIHAIYRWRRNLLAGRGIHDEAKVALITATADGALPITWEDFRPAQLVEPQSAVAGSAQ